MEALVFIAAIAALLFGGRYVTRKLRMLKLTPQPDEYELTKDAYEATLRVIKAEKAMASLLKRTLKALEKDRAAV